MNTARMTAETARPKNPASTALARHTRAFARDEDGALIIFGVFMFCMMLAIAGLSFDLMRYESRRVVLQSTSDRATLAAASLTQALDPQLVVADYFAKAGLSDYLDTVVVTEVLGSRKVEVAANLYMPLHHGRFSVFDTVEGPAGDVLMVSANSTALEAIGDVEISMVLDVSGSMGSYNRLTNLKTASENFIDMVYGSAETGTVSTSVVPYAEQVSAGPLLLGHYTLDESAHTNSYCVNFSSSDYSSASLSTSTPLQQTLHFDPWTDDNNWDMDSNVPDPLWSPVCRPQESRRIMAWEEDPDVLKAHINSFYSGGNTSTDIGLKWGTALLDPGSQETLTSMVLSGDVDPSLIGRPDPYDDGETMKIIVVMSDGENTSQHYMKDPYRAGDSAFYKWVDNTGDSFFSVWTGEGEPDFDPDPECTKWKNGKCKKWQLPSDWYRVNNEQQAVTPYGGDEAIRLTWTQLWAIFPVDEMTDEILENMSGQGDEIDDIEDALSYHSGSTKNTRMAAICTAAKAQGITIFAVALETNDNAATRLSDCATSPSHFFRVTGSELNFAFQAIASQINQLRLVH